jgi:hypothetical protein
VEATNRPYFTPDVFFSFTDSSTQWVVFRSNASLRQPRITYRCVQLTIAHARTHARTSPHHQQQYIVVGINSAFNLMCSCAVVLINGSTTLQGNHSSASTSTTAPKLTTPSKISTLLTLFQSLNNSTGYGLRKTIFCYGILLPH